MQSHNALSSFGRLWIEELFRVVKYACMLAGFVMLIKYGFVGALYVIFQSAVFVIGVACFVAAGFAVIAGIPSVIAHWRRRDELAGLATVVVILVICWMPILALMAGRLLSKLSGEFMVIDLPGT